MNLALKRILLRKVPGKNRFDGILESGSYNGSGEKQADPAFIRTANATGVLALQDYALSFDGSLTETYLFYFDANNSFISYEPKYGITSLTTFTTPANCAYVRWNCISPTMINTFFQLELGTVATGKEPYRG